MKSIDGFGRAIAILLGVLFLSATLGSGLAAQEKQYVTTTLRGTLTDPGSGKPMVGARFRFLPTNSSYPAVEAVTDAAGSFEARGLPFDTYAIEIVTASGEIIRGINPIPVDEGDSFELDLTLSDRVVSKTDLINQPSMFVAAVEREPTKWRRFWKQFAIFLGLAAGSAAAFD